MWLQVIFPVTGLYLGLVGGLAAAAETAPKSQEGHCFDFNSKIVIPLHAVIPRAEKGDSSKHGKLVTGAGWGAIRGEVKKPLFEVLTKLYDHNLMKSQRVKDMDVVELESPKHLARHQVTYKIYPFPFITIEWTEDWAYTLSQGTAVSPTEVVIAYEKTNGTSYIEHLCGNMVMRKSGEKATDVFLYEEAIAIQRDENDTVSGLMGTLAGLRAISADHETHDLGGSGAGENARKPTLRAPDF